MLVSDTPISREVMQATCPAIFASSPHSSRSDKYRFISTIDVLDALFDEGYHAYTCGQTTPRDTDRFGTAKHIVRMRKITTPGIDVKNEIVLKNAHNGESRSVLYAGVFRTVCMNGLIAGDIAQEIGIRHTGTTVGDYVEGAYEIIKQFDKVDDSRHAMEQTFLSTEDYKHFAEEALKLRWPDPETEHVDASYFTYPNRQVDLKKDLFTMFNIIQENLLRGGIYGYTNKHNHKKVRAITGIDQIISINKGLWTLADSMIT